MSQNSWGPTPKKPRLDIAKSGFISKPSVRPSVVNPSSSKKDINNDDAVWDDGFDFELISQVEHDERMAISQITQSSAITVKHINQKVVSKQVEIPQESYSKKNVISSNKNTHGVPLRRFGSSQWPTSNHFNNSLVPGKDPASSVYLHTDIERMRIENQRLKEELNKKTGEARILRDKVNSSEKEKDRIRRELMSKMETLKAEEEQNRRNLLKLNKSLQSQLDVKNMEIKTAERKLLSSSLNRIQPDSPNRQFASSSRSLQRDSPERDVMAAKTQALPLKFLRDSVLPELLELSPPEGPVSASAHPSNPGLFSGVLGIESSNTLRSRSTRKELPPSHTSVSSCAGLLLSPGLVDITSDYAQQTISQMVDICHKSLLELLKQLESASCSNNRFIERERELLMTGSRQLPLDQEYDLISHRELYRGERGISARRALGLMSLLLQASNFTAKKLLSSSPKESLEVLDTVRNIVRQIEKQRRTLMFQGVLTGSVALIMCLLKSETAISKETQTLLVDVLRWVVLSRPGSLVVRNVLQTLLAAARFPPIIESLCHNSADKTYKENPRHAIIQFTPDSCLLQMLCCVVRAAETPRKHRLTELLTRWVLSLFCGGHAAPRWLTTAPTATSCQCHVLLCKLCFSLVSEACFAYRTASEDDCQLLERVLAHGVLLMNIFMNEDEHMQNIFDTQSLGCYEHFLNFMSEAKITLDTHIKEFLAFLCKQEEVLKQPTNAMTSQNAQLPVLTAFNLFKVGDKGQSSASVANTLDLL